MIQRAKSILSFAALACVPVLLLVSFPKAAHALAAALVQITNTADNPAVTQDVSMRASLIVKLICVDDIYDGRVCRTITGSKYVVPAGKSLVVTAVDITAPVQDNVYLYGVPPGTATGYVFAGYVGISGQLHYTYPSGIVWAAGDTPSFSSVSTPQLHLYGYLTSN